MYPLNSRFLDILLWVVMIAGLLGPIAIMIKDWRDEKMREFKLEGIFYAAVVAEDGTGPLIVEDKSFAFSPETALERALEYRKIFSEAYTKAYPIVGVAQIDLRGKVVKEVKNDEIV